MMFLRVTGTALLVLTTGWSGLPSASAAPAWGDVEAGCEGTGGQVDGHRRGAAAHHRLAYLEHFYRQFSGERAVALAAMLPHDMAWNVTGWRTDVVPFAGEYVGRRQIAEHFLQYFASIRIQDYDFEYKLSDGDHVTWHYRLVAQVRSTGKTFDGEFVDVWQFGDDGSPISCRTYYDTQLMVDAFSVGGPAHVTDRKNPNDDFVVRASSYDVQALVARLYDLFYAGDLATVFSMVSDDVAVYFQGKDNPQSGEYHGLAGVQQFAMNLAGTAYPYDIQRFYVTEGDRTDVVLFENWTVYATGKSYHVHTVNSWRVNAQGQLMGFLNYPDIDEVAAAYVP